MRDYHINIFYSEEDEGYIADIPDLECCSAFGHTPEEAWPRSGRRRRRGLRPPKRRAGPCHRQPIGPPSTKPHLDEC